MAAEKEFVSLDTTTKNNHGKKIIAIVIGLILLCAILYFGRNILFKKSDLAKFSTNDVLKEIPKGTPIEEDIAEILGKATTSPDGQGQLYTVIFNSKKTTVENYEKYKAYCGENGWEVSGSSSTKKLICAKGEQVMEVTFSNVTIPVLSTPGPDSPQQGESSVFIKFTK